MTDNQKIRLLARTRAADCAWTARATRTPEYRRQWWGEYAALRNFIRRFEAGEILSKSFGWDTWAIMGESWPRGAADWREVARVMGRTAENYGQTLPDRVAQLHAEQEIAIAVAARIEA